MQDPIGIPACFSSGNKPADDSATVTRSGQSVFMSVYRTKVADHSRLITITWCKNVLLHGLSVSVEGKDQKAPYACKVELKPWYFWRKQGKKRFLVENNKEVDIFWDLNNAKFNGETEPSSDYYVAVVCDGEVVLLLGDLKKEAYRKTGCRPAIIDPVLVTKKEHIFGKKKFSTRVKFHGKGRIHHISIESRNGNISRTSGGAGNFEPEMDIRVDGHLGIHVKHLQWKFRGNEAIIVNKGLKVEVYWDVHDWLFNPGLRHALFIFKPIMSLLPPRPSSSSTTSTPLSSQRAGTSGSCSDSSSSNTSGPVDGINNGSSEFCLFLYAWKVE